MNTIDFVILIPILIGFVFGLFKGFIKELASLAAIFLGIYGAKYFSPQLAVFLQKSAGFSAITAKPVAFIIVFIIIAVLLLILAKWLDKFFDAVSLSTLNKIFGGLFGALKYTLVVSVLLTVFDAVDSKFSIVQPEAKSSSFLFRPVKNLAPQLWTEAKTYRGGSENRSEHEGND